MSETWTERAALLTRIAELERERDEAYERAASCFNDVPNVNFIRERIRALKRLREWKDEKDG